MVGTHRALQIALISIAVVEAAADAQMNERTGADDLSDISVLKCSNGVHPGAADESAREATWLLVQGLGMIAL